MVDSNGQQQQENQPDMSARYLARGPSDFLH